MTRRRPALPAFLSALQIVALSACAPVVDLPASPSETAVVERNTNQDLTLVGANGESAVITVSDLAQLPRERVTFSRHDDVSIYEGPLLLDVLARVGVRASPLHKSDQATAVLITAADGYQVVFGLGETDPATRPDRIILAVTDDGAPLTPEYGPFMIVAEGDARAARSPRMVASIRVLPLGEPSD